MFIGAEDAATIAAIAIERRCLRSGRQHCFALLAGAAKSVHAFRLATAQRSWAPSMPSPSTSRITRVISPNVPEPEPRTWSNCLVVDGIAYIAGMVARGKDGKVIDGDEYDQARLIFAKLRHLVEAAGGVMADIVKLTIFVTDITQRERVWRARAEVFTDDFPVSTLVQVAALAQPAIKVEIDAIAHIGAGKR
jgi:2-iminobutanoate/2-iminopropanoate deaminase